MTAIARVFQTLEERQPVRRVDRVSAFGAVLALAGCFLPFVEFRANRIATGVYEPLSTAGVWGWALAVACVLALAASVLRGRMRGSAVLAAGAAMLVLLPWALGASAVELLADADPISRVSIGYGAWAIFFGGVIVWFEGAKLTESLALRTLVGIAAISGLAASVVWGGVSELSLAQEYAVQSERFWKLLGEHLILSGAGLLFGTLIGIPLGVAAARNRVVRSVGLGTVAIIQTVPSLALLGLLVIPLTALGLPGIGTLPATIALTLYALLPIVRNTFVGVDGVDSAILDAGRGMGMSRRQLLFRVEAPLALPLVLEGVRAAAVLVVGIAAVTAFVGAGGLGVLVFQGWGQQADDLTLLGAVPMVVLAVLVDALIRTLSRVTVSPGIRGTS